MPFVPRRMPDVNEALTSLTLDTAMGGESRFLHLPQEVLLVIIDIAQDDHVA